MTASIRKQLERLSAGDRKFSAILADVPWRFATWDKQKAVRRRTSKALHYRTTTFGFLAHLPVLEVAARHCVLFLWVPWPHLRDGLHLIDLWGFVYKSCAFDWMKVTRSGAPAMGLGYWTRANSEICLLATRGHPQRQSRGVPMAILKPRRLHSQKPDCVHDRIEKFL